MVTTTRTQAEAEARRAAGRDASFEVDFFCKSCKGHYTLEYRPALGEPLRCRCGAVNVLIYSAVRM